MSQPPSYANKYLVACDGDQISLTCSHDNAVSGTTTSRWIMTPPVDCSTSVIHRPPIEAPQCGPFTFHAVNEALSDVSQLNSTAMATASTMMSNTVVECRAGNIAVSSSVGNLTLCIIG